MKTVILICIVLVLSACATNPDKIAPQYVSSKQYESLTCAEIHDEIDEVGARVNNIHRKLRKDRNHDNAAMTVGMILFWPALFFLDGDSPDTQTYARLKGEAEALEKAHNRNNCT